MADEHASELRRSKNPVRTVAIRALVGAAILGVVAWGGQYFGHKVPAIGLWISALGIWGPLAFLLLLVLCTSLFVPDMLFAMFAGTVFGFFQGCIVMAIGALLTASLNFWISRQLLRERVRRVLRRYPRFEAIESAASGEGIRLLVLLRLTPIHGVSLSYVLGASRVSFSAFFVSSFAMVPMLIVEVYFGYLAAHLAITTGTARSASVLHTAVAIIGFVVCVVVILYITRLAKRALGELGESAEYEPNR